jgi:hypothetical protein
MNSHIKYLFYQSESYHDILCDSLCHVISAILHLIVTVSYTSYSDQTDLCLAWPEDGRVPKHVATNT